MADHAGHLIKNFVQDQHPKRDRKNKNRYQKIGLQKKSIQERVAIVTPDGRGHHLMMPLVNALVQQLRMNQSVHPIEPCIEHEHRRHKHENNIENGRPERGKPQTLLLQVPSECQKKRNGQERLDALLDISNDDVSRTISGLNLLTFSQPPVQKTDYGSHEKINAQHHPVEPAPHDH